MIPIDLTVPLGIGTPAWPTYEPLQMKYFKRLDPLLDHLRGVDVVVTGGVGQVHHHALVHQVVEG